MSSTNRSNTRDSHIADYYVTPKDPIRKMLAEFFNEEINIFKNENKNLIGDGDNNYFQKWLFGKSLFLDPCAGGDKKHEMSYPAVLSSLGYNCDTIDI